MSFGKNELTIKECITTYAKENSASGKVLEKLGFRFIQEESYICNGGEIETTGIRVMWKDDMKS